MMKRFLYKIRRPAVVGMAVIALAASPGLAVAQTDDTVSTTDSAATDRPLVDRPERDHDLGAIKERILGAIDKRLEALDRLSAAVAENEHVTKGHQKDLEDDYKDAEKILDAAAKAVEKAETLAELREVVPAAFQETLVFALQAPKTHLVVASDRMVSAYERMEGFAGHLQAAIARLTKAGHDMTAAQAALDEMIRLLDLAEDLGAPVADDVIGLDPTDWPDPAKGALEQGKADLEAARGFLREASASAHETIKAIRAAMGG